MFEFRNRVDAGRRLGQRLAGLLGEGVVVLGLPRGGVPVAAEVAAALNAPLDVIVVRKLGVPFQPELAMGAIGEGDTRVLDRGVLSVAHVTENELRTVEQGERELLESRVALYRRGRARTDLKGRTVVIVDDGIATGSTARVACRVARQLGAARVILAVPVASARVLGSLSDADQVFSLVSARNFQAVGYYYRDFSPTKDDEVVQLLDAAARRLHPAEAEQSAGVDQEVHVPASAVNLQADMHLPRQCGAVVVVAHGSGRHSPRNRHVASVLQDAGLGTLLLDLLTPAEEVSREKVFDIALLAGRLMAATRWLETRGDTAGSRIGYLGAGTAAGAALWAAADPGNQVAAIVSMGGLPDLAGPRLAAVRAPTLMIAGSADPQLLALNRYAMELMRAPTRLRIIPGATHLFEEPGTLTQAATFAADWFTHYLLPVRNEESAPEVLL
ncbi:MAG TPA: phosphoribosyltransferase family protein [Arthrobacter sp.]|nr:phosphoribosyltransferase family protein [Arthrobacter sp.]